MEYSEPYLIPSLEDLCKRFKRAHCLTNSSRDSTWLSLRDVTRSFYFARLLDFLKPVCAARYEMRIATRSVGNDHTHYPFSDPAEALQQAVHGGEPGPTWHHATVISTRRYFVVLLPYLRYRSSTHRCRGCAGPLSHSLGRWVERIGRQGIDSERLTACDWQKGTHRQFGF